MTGPRRRDCPHRRKHVSASSFVPHAGKTPTPSSRWRTPWGGIISGHANMPEFQFESDDVGTIIAVFQVDAGGVKADFDCLEPLVISWQAQSKWLFLSPLAKPTIDKRGGTVCAVYRNSQAFLRTLRVLRSSSAKRLLIPTALVSAFWASAPSFGRAASDDDAPSTAALRHLIACADNCARLHSAQTSLLRERRLI